LIAKKHRISHVGIIRLEPRAADRPVSQELQHTVRKAQDSGRSDLLWFSPFRAIYSRSSNLYTFKLFDVVGWYPNGKFSDKADLMEADFHNYFYSQLGQEPNIDIVQILTCLAATRVAKSNFELLIL
jgi:hypothetical protein